MCYMHKVRFTPNFKAVSFTAIKIYILIKLVEHKELIDVYIFIVIALAAL